MNINKHNYEAFFLDYHEGNLSPQQVADLLLFVEQHPELREEFESFENVSLEDLSSVSFENKSSLKKEITTENKDNYLIGSIENTLSITEQNLLATFLKQHHQFLNDLELFKKTKLQADTAVVFENKEKLKEIALSTDYLLIASVEGLLSNQEQSMLKHQLSGDAEMNNNFALYKQTKLIADPAIIYENKEELKRKERKVIPIFYYVAAAAAVLLLFGIFSLFNNTSSEKPGFANEKINTHSIKQKVEKENVLPPAEIKTPGNNNLAQASPAKKQSADDKAIVKTNVSTKDSLKKNPINNELENKNLATTNPENKEQPIVAEQPVIKNDPQINTHNETPAVASVESKKTEKQEEFLSLGQMAAKKIKEKTLDADSYASEKKNGKLKKISGWDVLQAVAKGVSKVTGKKVEVKPTYNEEGDVTAYAFNAGKLGFSKEK